MRMIQWDMLRRILRKITSTENKLSEFLSCSVVLSILSGLLEEGY